MFSSFRAFVIEFALWTSPTLRARLLSFFVVFVYLRKSKENDNVTVKKHNVPAKVDNHEMYNQPAPLSWNGRASRGVRYTEPHGFGVPHPWAWFEIHILGANPLF